MVISYKLMSAKMSKHKHVTIVMASVIKFDIRLEPCDLNYSHINVTFLQVLTGASAFAGASGGSVLLLTTGL